jgi:hypothetical protein
MAWNEPGNGKDPWKNKDETPNDLDKIVQNWPVVAVVRPQDRPAAIFLPCCCSWPGP